MHRPTEEDLIRQNALEAAGSGALAGTAYGTITSLLGGVPNRKALMKAVLRDAAHAAAIGGGGSYVGNEILGLPGEQETTGQTRRAGLGGALVGGAAGGIYGGLAGAGKIHPNPDQLLTRYFSKLTPGRSGMIKGALAGAAGLGAIGSYLGSDEGMVQDFVEQERLQNEREDDEQRRRLSREYQR